MTKVGHYFDSEEFACKCGCGYAHPQPVLIGLLDMARMKAQIPFFIDSGCRCAKHNAEEGGKQNSAHLRGYAADIRAPGSVERYKVISSAIFAGFHRVGIGKDFVHVDCDPDLPAEVIWLDRKSVV
jgi:hypothetical protein